MWVNSLVKLPNISCTTLASKCQEGVDSAKKYFSCNKQVASVQDTRFQALMPGPLHFFGRDEYSQLHFHVGYEVQCYCKHGY